MRLVIQRVTHASVTVDNQVVGRCGVGFCILVGVKNGDTQAEAKWLANKTANLRIFEDAAGKMNLSLLDVKGEALVISQFTLYADAQRGRRPDFIDAARPEQAEPLIEYFVEQLRAEGVPVQTGVFRALMHVEIHNDGPVTILLEREKEG
ncbi:MAG TPA: D-aminoacyl-tRNA deacylase [Anaerolineae bacterium]|nr:D-aminoacyl-tRNA deacylase [Anaerolineae bacterium]